MWGDMSLCLFFNKLKKLFIYAFIYLWLHWVFVAACRLSLVVASWGYSSLWCAGFSLRWLLLLQSVGSRYAGISSCGMWAQELWHTGLVAPWHAGSSRTRARTRVPYIGRWILNHWATREAHGKPSFKDTYSKDKNKIFWGIKFKWQ